MTVLVTGASMYGNRHYRTLIPAALLLVVLGLAPSALAQAVPESGGRVFGLVGGSFGDGGSALVTSGGAGLRLTRRLGLDLEVLHVRELDLREDGRDRDGVRPLPAAAFLDINHTGTVTAFLAKISVEFPTGTRLIPFVSGGGGIARLAEEFSFDFRRPLPLPIALRPDILPSDIERSQTNLALTVGGGLDIQLWRGFAVGADVRWLRMFADQRTLDFAQVASRVSYRF